MKLKHTLLPILTTLVVIVLFLVYHIVFHKNEALKSTVYVDNVMLFSGFNMTNDIKRTYEIELITQKSIVDSLVSDLQKANENSIDEHLQRLFISENNKLKEMNDYFMNELSNQVWERLNIYIQEFGEINGYALILGTQGAGNIMHADESLDVTMEFLEFANNKYEGK